MHAWFIQFWSEFFPLLDSAIPTDYLELRILRFRSLDLSRSCLPSSFTSYLSWAYIIFFRLHSLSSVEFSALTLSCIPSRRFSIDWCHALYRTVLHPLIIALRSDERHQLEEQTAALRGEAGPVSLMKHLNIIRIRDRQVASARSIFSFISLSSLPVVAIRQSTAVTQKTWTI